MSARDAKLIIYADKQKADLFVNEQLLKTYVVSTSANGLGSESGSNKTPVGLFAVSEKFGTDAASGTVFKVACRPVNYGLTTKLIHCMIPRMTLFLRAYCGLKVVRLITPTPKSATYTFMGQIAKTC